MKMNGLLPEANYADCANGYRIHYLDEGVFITVAVHGDAGNKGKGTVFCFINHFIIPPFEILPFLAPAMKLFRIIKSVKFFRQMYQAAGVRIFNRVCYKTVFTLL